MGAVTSKDEMETLPYFSPSKSLMSVLPLGTNVVVHLVPKFATGDVQRAETRYNMNIFLERAKKDSKAENSLKASVNFTVEVHRLENEVNDEEETDKNRLLHINTSMAENVVVDFTPHERLSITGDFIMHPEITRFELVLCPSRDMIKTEDGEWKDWLLLGTCYTNSKHVKRVHRWRAAVRPDLS